MINKVKKNYNNFFGQLLFLVVIIMLGLLIFFKLNYLLSSFLGSITLYFLLRKASFYLIEKKRWHPWVASLALTLSTVLLLGSLVFVVVNMLIGEIPSFDIMQITDQLTKLAGEINSYTNVEIVSPEIILNLKSFFSTIISSLFNTTYMIVINLFMMFFILYFLLLNGRGWEKNFLKYFPLQGEGLAMMKSEAKKMIFGNAIGIPVIMTVQFVLSLTGYWIAGCDRVFFFAFFTAIFGLVPIFGTACIWAPVGIYLLMTGELWQGVFLLAYSFIIVTYADTFCRLVLMKSMLNTHPLIVVFGVILGVPLFGFWGIIFGPLLISGFLLLIKIYYYTYRNKSAEEEINIDN